MAVNNLSKIFFKKFNFFFSRAFFYDVYGVWMLWMCVKIELYKAEDYFWARMVVVTRIFGISILGRETSALVRLIITITLITLARCLWLIY